MSTVRDNRDNDCDGRVDEEICLDGEDFDHDGVGDEDCESTLISHQPNLQPKPGMAKYEALFVHPQTHDILFVTDFYV